MNRIHGAKLLDDSFTISKAFDLEKYLADRWTIFADDPEPTTFRVRFHQKVARYIHEFQFYANIDLKTEADGSVLLTTTLKSRKEFLRWVRGFGLTAELLEPEHIRAELMEEYGMQIERYR